MFYSIFEMSDNSVISIVFMILGGLGAFLYGLNLMSASLKTIAGNRFRAFIAKATDNIWAGFLSGLLITLAIQSSSATTVIVIGLISAGLLDLKHALPIMIGAHIGTTITAYIIGANIGSVAFPLIFIGSMIILLIAQRKWKLTGRIIIGTGFLFLGLEMMSVSFSSVAGTDWFKNTMEVFSSNWILGFISGIFLTCIIQSSSAFIGIVQDLYVATGSTMALKVAITLVIGSNIGTTITALIASIGSNRVAKQAAIGNVIAAMVGSIIFLPLLVPMTAMFGAIQNALFNGSKSMFTIAFYHTFHNIINSGLCMLILPLIIKLTKKILPDKIDKNQISAERLNKELLVTPSLALDSARNSIKDMNNLVLQQYLASVQYFQENTSHLYDDVSEMEEKVDLYEHLIHDYLMQLTETHLSTSDSFRQSEYIDIIRDMERVGDHAMNFAEFFQTYYERGVKMPDNMHDALNKFFDIITLQIQDSLVAFDKSDKNLAKVIIKREMTVDQMEKEYRLNVHSYLKAGEVNQLDILYIDIVSNLERISDHTTNIAQMIIDPHMMSTMITGAHEEVVDKSKLTN